MKKTLKTTKELEMFPAFIELFREEDMLSKFYAESMKDYKDKLFDLIEEHELYHEWIDTCSVKEEGCLNVALKTLESFRVCSRETWEQRKALYETQNEEGKTK